VLKRAEGPRDQGDGHVSRGLPGRQISLIRGEGLFWKMPLIKDVVRLVT
jgi:hypothetical protein